jgi:hypothetical protein
MAAWIKPGNDPGSCCLAHQILGKNAEGRYMAFGVSYGMEIYAYFQDSDGSYLNPRFRTEESVPVGDGAWHLVAAVKNGTDAFLYYDGELVASDHISSIGSISNTGNLLIGGGSSGFNGVIDEVKLWSRPLGAAEIYSEYENSR